VVADDVLTALELTADNIGDNLVIADKEGGANYTASGSGGFWYDADGNVVEYGDSASFYVQSRYGSEKMDEGILCLETGIMPDSTTAGTYKATIRLVNTSTKKHVTVNVTITVSE